MADDVLAHFLAHIQAMQTPFQLCALADTIAASYSEDAATARLLAIIRAKVERVTAAN